MDPFAYSSESENEAGDTVHKVNIAPQLEIPRLVEIGAIDLIVKPNHITGSLENIQMNEFEFNKQYHTYQNFGYAIDPSNPNSIVTNQSPDLESE